MRCTKMIMIILVIAFGIFLTNTCVSSCTTEEEIDTITDTILMLQRSLEIMARDQCTTTTTPDKTTTSNPPTTHESVACAENSTFDNRLCYTYFNYSERANWFNANDTCHSIGGILAEPRTLAENNFIKHLLQETLLLSFTWLGGNDIDTEGQWVWSTGDPITGYTNWYNGRQPPYDGRDCLGIGNPWHRQAWINIDCHAYYLPFVCQTALA